MSIEKIKTDDFDKMLFKSARGRTNPIFKVLLDLKPGDAIKIDKSHWNKRYSITRILHYIRKNYHYEFTGGRLADGSGWAYRREK